MDPTPFELFLGRLHVVLVHFPIALIATGGVVELLQRGPRAPERFAPGLFCIVVGAVGAVLAAVTGWWTAANEPPGPLLADLVDRHRWSGVATAVLASVTAVLGLSAWASSGAGGSGSRVRSVYRFGVFACVLLVGFTGHAGGTLVHGDGFLTDVFRASPSEASVEPATVDASSDPPLVDAPGASGSSLPESQRDVAHVRSLFAGACYECHGAGRAKGGLRLHDLSALLDDELGAWLISPGRPADSEILRRVELPAEDDEHMPKDGEPLAPEDIAVLRRWIAAGAPLDATLGAGAAADTTTSGTRD